jgi:hypothetical protein
MSWRAQNRSKDAKTPSVALAMSKNPEPDCCPVQPYIYNMPWPYAYVYLIFGVVLSEVVATQNWCPLGHVRCCVLGFCVLHRPWPLGLVAVAGDPDGPDRRHRGCLLPALCPSSVPAYRRLPTRAEAARAPGS